MKILVISNLYPPFFLGGYELGCKNIVIGLRDKGHEVLVLTSPSHVRDNDQNLACNSIQENHIARRLQLKSFQPEINTSEPVRLVTEFEALVSNYQNTCTVLDTIKEFSPDCIYLFNLVGIGGLAIIDAINNLNIPWALHLMDAVPYLLQGDFDQEILSVFNADKGKIYSSGQIISMSNHLVKEIETTPRFKFTNKVRLVPGWAKISSDILHREYFVSGKVRFVTAGAVQPHKGIDIILQAVAMLKNAGTENFTVDIYGDGNISHYIGMARHLGIFDFVNFHGQRSQAELLNIYEHSDAFLFPTWEREPFGFAPVEAASVGCIPIITRICGVAERLVDQVNCIKIERNQKSLFKTMLAFCSKQINFELIGLNAQKITRSELNFNKCLDDIDAILHQCSYSKNDYKIPNWKNYNLAYLKHNIAYRNFNTGVLRLHSGGASNEIEIILKKIVHRLGLLKRNRFYLF